MVKSFKKKTKKKIVIIYIILFLKFFLIVFFPSFNSKIETWVICEAQKKKKNHYYLYYMIFKIFFNCFFFKFQFQNWNWGNLWSSSLSIPVNNFKIHPKFLNLKEVQTQQDTTSPIQHTNIPTKNKNTYKWSEILRYSRTHCCGCTTGPKKKKKKKIMSACV